MPNILYRQQALSVQVNAIQSSNSYTSVHKINGSNRSASEKSKDLHVLLASENADRMTLMH